MGSSFRIVISISAFLITISSVYTWSYLPVKSTTFWWIVYFFLVILLVKSKQFVYHKALNDRNLLIFKVYLLWNIICIVRGLFAARDYWDWKLLIETAMVMMVPLVVYSATNTFMLQKIISLWLKYTLPVFVILMPFIYVDAVGRYLIPISFILLFFPILKNKWKMLSFLVIIFVVMIDLSARSNVLKFLVPLSMSLLYYFNKKISEKLISIVRYFLIITPIVLIILGITNTFNVFKMSDYIEGDYAIETHEGNSEGTGDLRTDTRTFLYEEVILSAIKYDHIWLGRTPALGNESPSFGPQLDEARNTDKMERPKNEVSILNTFTWTGMIGVILFFLVCVYSTHLATYNSKSLFVKIVGLYVSFRWFYSWIEDFSEFDLSTFFLWICIGVCYSESFRKLNDQEIYLWVQGFFTKRDRIVYIKSQFSKIDYLKNNKAIIE